MPVNGYFSKEKRITMPRADEGTADAGGLVLHGDVLTGKLSVQEALAREAARLSQTLPIGKRVGPQEFDPVLKFHLGIK